MGSYLLLAAGVLFAALFALNNLLKTLFRRHKIGFADTLLAFLVTLVPLAALILAQTTSDTPDGRITRLALWLGAGLAVFSLLLTLLELFRAQRLKGSRGILGMVAGLLLMIASISVPMTAAYITDQASEPAAAPRIVLQSSATSDSSQIEAAASAEVNQTPTGNWTPTMLTPSSTPTALPSNTPRPTRTPSATRFQYSTRTPTPTPTPVTPCVASVEYNLRLRAAPSAVSETLLVIPFSTTVELYGKGIPSEGESRWWYTVYEGQSGWLDGQYMLVGSACDTLPLREAD
ncbi:MAG: hypothetical protein ABI835_01780 [Chloroflexota bacterium]